MSVVTITTDFGSGDHEAGVLKGVIWDIAPTAHIVDLSHEITAQSILEGALLLWRAAPYFPDGTIHLAIVDPGVGTQRRGLAAQLGSKYFVGPDNGLMSLLMEREVEARQAHRFIALDQPEFWLNDVSKVFHGRDIFAPVAGHLAAGTPIEALGTPVSDPVRIQLPTPSRTANGWIGQVIHIDHFGNLATNLNQHHLKGKKEVRVSIKGAQISGLVSTFGERPKGNLIALLDSSGALAISVVNGSAAQSLQVKVGDPIEVRLQ